MKFQNKYIKEIGFEIECVFRSRDREAVQNLCSINNWVLSTDISIHTTRTYRCSAEIKFHYTLDELNSKIPELQKLFALVYSGKKYNAGGHIHLSFNDYSTYFKIATWEFVNHFQTEYKLFAKNEEEKSRIDTYFAKLYKSKADYIYQTNEQLKVSGKNNRYFTVNYNSYQAHNFQTIEFRVFCLTHKYSQLQKNIKFLLKTVNNYLKEVKPLDFEIKLTTPKKVGKIKVIKTLGFSETENVSNTENSGVQNEN